MSSDVNRTRSIPRPRTRAADPDQEALRVKLESLGFRSFPVGPAESPVVVSNWSRLYEGEPCRTNDKLQVVVLLHAVVYAGVRNTSITVDVTGEDDAGLWWKVECYTLRTDALDKLEGVIAQAIRAWNTLHRPGAS